MFETLRGVEEKKLNHNGRSHIGETMQFEGDLRSSGSLDVAGLVNGSIFVSEMIITEAGSVRGSIEAANIEVNGHVEGKISADVVVVGKNAVIKGDIFFKNTLKTEEGISKGKSDTEEDIAIEEIVDREDSTKPKVVHVGQHKEAV